MARASHTDSYQQELAQYVKGFVLSVMLTASAYVLVSQYVSGSRGVSYGIVLAAIILLALVQFGVQTYYFLHLGVEARPRWKRLALGFMIAIVSILVIGSLWIMQNLDYNMSLPDASMDIIKDEGIRR
jgi:cytochrome o ubiquinol oxidase subunit IV